MVLITNQLLPNLFLENSCLSVMLMLQTYVHNQHEILDRLIYYMTILQSLVQIGDFSL